MNKICISVLTMAVLLGCSDNEENIINDDELVPIELNAEVNLISRGAIGNNTKLTDVGIAGWEAQKDEAGVSYTANPTWHTHIDFTASAEKQNVTFKQPQYYNSNPDIYTHIKAWYPCAEYTGTTNPLTSSTITFKNENGSMDVLLAQEIVVGSKNEKISKPLTFKHVTSQIKFKVKKGDGLADNTKIKSIKIKNAQYPTRFDISKSFTDDKAITYSDAADLLVPNINDTQVITDDAVQAGDAVMIRPFAASKFIVDIETSNATYSNCEISLTSGTQMQAGYLYDITLTFGQAGLELSAIVEEWKNGTGSAEIQ